MNAYYVQCVGGVVNTPFCLYCVCVHSVPSAYLLHTYVLLCAMTDDSGYFE